MKRKENNFSLQWEEEEEEEQYLLKKNFSLRINVQKKLIERPLFSGTMWNWYVD